MPGTVAKGRERMAEWTGATHPHLPFRFLTLSMRSRLLTPVNQVGWFFDDVSYYAMNSFE